MADLVEILLATHDGAVFLRDQLDSILQQNYPQIKIIVRDDASVDETAAILEEYASKYPQKIRTIYNTGIAEGPIKNFSNLISQATAPYILFSDQDDYWLSDRVERFLDKIKSLEEIHGTTTPILVHSDLIVVDENLKTLSPSFWRYSGLNPKNVSLNRLLVQNVVTGCASIINRSLIEICLPIPAEALMHDWWIAMVASAMGVIGILDETTIKYRQHKGNTLGAKKFSLNPINIIQRLKKIPSFSNKYFLIENRIQAKAFRNAYDQIMNKEKKQILDHFIDLINYGFFKRRYYLLRNQYLRCNLLQNIYLFLRV